MRFGAACLSVAVVGAALVLAAPCKAECTGASPSWASTPDFESVAACVDGASAGDSISVSAGAATWGAGARVSVTKSLTITGAGATETTIVDEGPTGSPFTITLSGSDSASISGFGFARVAQDPPNYDGIIGFATSGTTFSRVHHCRFDDVDGRSIATASPYLLVDANVFTCVSAWCAPLIIIGDRSGDHPMDYGGPSFVFVENNTFDFSAVTDGERDGALDCKDKGRFVFRHNTVLGTRVMNHGFDSTISCMSFEIYDNSFTDDGPDYQNGFFVQLRGGTGLIHGNEMGGSTELWGAPLGATNYRSCSDNAQIAAVKPCDGTVYGVCTGEAWGEWADCTSDPECADLSAGTCERKWCSTSLDILCTTADECPEGETCTGATDGSGPNGYPCRDQIGRGQNQESAPLYLWDNVAYGEGVGLAVMDNGGGTCFTAEHIQLDRDYCEHDPSTSCGDVAGWSYTPFACPHPATGLTGACDPTAAGKDGYPRGCEGPSCGGSGGGGGTGAAGAGGAASGGGGAEPSDDGGCGCRSSSHSMAGGAAVWLLAVGALGATRRRRRR